MTELPQGEPLSIPVSLVCMAAQPVRVVPATVRGFDGTTYEVEAPDADIEADAEVVLDFSRQDLPLVRARLVEHAGDRLHLAILTSKEHDPREFPRMAAGIGLRYLRAGPDVSEDDRAAWLRGGEAPAGDWHVPDPLMDFSASGLAFEDAAACVAGEHLLLELKNPAGTGAWRGLGQVVRAEHDPEGGRWQIAVSLTDLPAEAVQALLEFTVELQEGALGDPERDEA